MATDTATAPAKTETTPAAVPAPRKPRTRKTGNPQADRAAKPAAAKPTTAPATTPAKTEPEPKPLTVSERKKIVAAQLIAAAAELAASWSHDDVSRDEATALLSAWCNYIPGGIWDDRLGQRSGAGKRTATATS